MTTATVSQRALGIKDMPESEKAHHRGLNDRIVPDEDMESALSWLRDSAKAIGDAKARLVKASSMIKHVEALLFLASEQKSVEAKKADVRTRQKWLDAVNEEAEAAGEFEKLRALREAANARCEAWRTESANFRGMRI